METEGALVELGATTEIEADMSVDAELEALSAMSFEQLQAIGAIASSEQIAEIEAEAANVAHLESMMPIQSLSEVDEHIRQGVAFMQLEEAVHLDVEGAMDAYTEMQSDMMAMSLAHGQSQRIGKFFKKVGKSIKKVANKAGSAIKKVANKAGNAIKKVATDVAKGACKIGQKTCYAGCDAAKGTIRVCLYLRGFFFFFFLIV